MLPIAEFERFREAIADLPMKGLGEKYARAELIRPHLLLFSDSGLDVYYVPFHFVNGSARVVLLGLTPGWTQMEEAFRAARKGLAEGLDGRMLFERIDRTGSFSGPMRRNLVEMLDRIGLNSQLRIETCHGLFDTSSRLAHFTSAVSAPIFKQGENYRGYGPRLLEVPRLKQWVVENLARELASIPKAIVIPLGGVADEVIMFLAERRLFDSSRCLIGFPHPSGANGHRKEQFTRGRERWRGQVAEWFARQASEVSRCQRIESLQYGQCRLRAVLTHYWELRKPCQTQTGALPEASRPASGQRQNQYRSQ